VAKFALGQLAQSKTAQPESGGIVAMIASRALADGGSMDALIFTSPIAPYQHVRLRTLHWASPQQKTLAHFL
jgi:hypothetical protein